VRAVVRPRTTELPDTASSARWEGADRPFLTEAFKSAGVDYDATAPELTDTGTMPEEDQAFELKLRGELLGVPPKKDADVFDFSFVKKAAAELKAENWKPKTGSRSP